MVCQRQIKYINILSKQSYKYKFKTLSMVSNEYLHYHNIKLS